MNMFRAYLAEIDKELGKRPLKSFADSMMSWCAKGKEGSHLSVARLNQWGLKSLRSILTLGFTGYFLNSSKTLLTGGKNIGVPCRFLGRAIGWQRFLSVAVKLAWVLNGLDHYSDWYIAIWRLLNPERVIQCPILWCLTFISGQFVKSLVDYVIRWRRRRFS